MFSILLSVPLVELLGHVVIFLFNLLRSCQTVSKVMALFCVFPPPVWKDSVSLHPCQQLLFSFYCVLVGMSGTHCGSDLHFLMINHVDLLSCQTYLVMCLLDICISSWERCLFRSFACFFSWVFDQWIIFHVCLLCFFPCEKFFLPMIFLVCDLSFSCIKVWQCRSWVCEAPLFMVMSFVSCLQKYFWTLRSENSSPKFSSGSSVVLPLSFESLMYLELVFLHGRSQNSVSFLFL